MLWGSRIMNLGSEGVYLDENGGTNPSRYLPGPKTPVKNLEISILGSRGVRTKIDTLGPLQINSGS